MKKINTAALLSIFLLLAPILAGAIDLELRAGAGDIAFDDDRVSPLSEEAPPGAFKPQAFPLVKIEASGNIDEAFLYHGGYERDPILRNRVYADLGYRWKFLTVEMGPFMGVFNNRDSILNPGASVGIGFNFPDIIFLDLKASSTLGGLLEDTGDYSQKTRNISLGFWVPYVVCSLNVETKEHTVLEKSESVIEDAVDRYFFRANVYTKNVPYTIQIDLGYQSLTRSYSDYSLVTKNTKTDEFKNLFLGFEAAYTIFPGLAAFLGGEMPLYAWSSGDMVDPPKSAFLFKFTGGVVWTLPIKQKN
jgi:hypothetical protein